MDSAYGIVLAQTDPAAGAGGGTRCYLVSDLHGNTGKYKALFSALSSDPPSALFLAGDILPPPVAAPKSWDMTRLDFVNDFLARHLEHLRRELGERYPSIYLILGNDDARFEEASVMTATTRHVWNYAHNRRFRFRDYSIYGYSYIPPSPFQNKDWERYDVSRYVDPGCVSPEDGFLTVPVSPRERRFSTIAKDLEALTEGDDLSRAVLLTHVPPYESGLDRADLDGTIVDGVPMDVHIGSIALRRLIQQKQPLVTLHGHVHESFRVAGVFKQQIGRTWCLSAADEGPGLTVVDFRLTDPGSAERRTIPV